MILSVWLTVGNTKIPTDFIAIIQAKHLRAGWYKETESGPAPLQTARMGAGLGMDRGTWVFAPLSFFSEVYQCFSGKVWHSTRYPGSLSMFSVKLVQPFFPLYHVTGYTEKKEQISAIINMFSNTVSLN